LELYLEPLRDSKNLLAFSAGLDSSALFFLLLEHGILFDIAIVDYQMRAESKDETAYAKELCKRYNRSCFIKKVTLNDSNFEHNARYERYKFFEQIIDKHNYQNLITAHQFNDKIEWFMMQLTKGAGLVELLGYKEFEKRDSYNIVRPMSQISKDEILDYLTKNHIKYFYDKSNSDPKYKRNHIRESIATNLVKEHLSGLKNSFKYLELDASKLFSLKIIFNEKDLFVLKRSDDEVENLRQIDKIVKKLGYILSASQKEEIQRVKDIVISDQISIIYTNDKIYISPYLKESMPKEFKELCRIKKIPAKIRPYLFTNSIDLKVLP
jgi:tRNA(Ile)-lysidine synthase